MLAEWIYSSTVEQYYSSVAVIIISLGFLYGILRKLDSFLTNSISLLLVFLLIYLGFVFAENGVVTFGLNFGLTFFSMYWFFVIGKAMGSGFILLFFSKHIIKPNLSSVNEVNITEIDEVNIHLSLPKTNIPKKNGEKIYQQKSADISPNDKYFPHDTVHFSYRWNYYQLDNEDIADIRLSVFTADLPGFAPFLDARNLNAAAAMYFYSRYCILPETEKMPDYKESRDYIPSMCDWSFVQDENITYITYDVYEYQSVTHCYRKFIHIPISNTRMLTLVFLYSKDRRQLNKLNRLNEITRHMELLMKNLLESWEISYLDSSFRCKVPDGVKIERPVLRASSRTLPSREEYRVFLREHARDPIAWAIFEKSDEFYNWFINQVKHVENEYKSSREKFIQDGVERCMSLRSHIDKKSTVIRLQTN